MKKWDVMVQVVGWVKIGMVEAKNETDYLSPTSVEIEVCTICDLLTKLGVSLSRNKGLQYLTSKLCSLFQEVKNFSYTTNEVKIGDVESSEIKQILLRDVNLVEGPSR